ncbi:MAG TPA: hypothetical protein VLF18_17570 [Tahibacter sp.]|nr:hypothetical protein [Tahibacter sp.]HSX62000.1 hypothetical protein [Tahibacter sp.]
MQVDDIRNETTASWRDEGPEAIARGLEPGRQPSQPVDESLWLALNAWG